MMEYTVAAVMMFLVALGLNLKFNPVFQQNKKAVIVALAVAALAQLIFDNMTVWRGFWRFNDAATVGLRIPFMPVENLLFGLALMLFTVLAWECTAKRVNGKSSTRNA
ncbi:lycopene cyclase domain-containing protein [Candidatus Micrarchaeota archaeon]|nr:lycopene cyclase domain-containing protein [Candidatus Micrarchaeota archaeon]